jgi:hypothetical protein
MHFSIQPQTLNMLMAMYSNVLQKVASKESIDSLIKVMLALQAIFGNMQSLVGEKPLSNP